MKLQSKCILHGSDGRVLASHPGDPEFESRVVLITFIQLIQNKKPRHVSSYTSENRLKNVRAALLGIARKLLSVGDIFGRSVVLSVKV